MSRSHLFLASLLVLILIECVFSQKAAKPQQELKFFVFTPQCFDKFMNGNYFDINCIKFTISKLLSYGIIAGSLLYKLPQIIKILKAGSVEGLSLSSFYVQFLMAVVTVGYNMFIKAPLSTYAENLSVGVQTFLLILLHWRYNPKTSTACIIASLIFFGAACAILLGDILPAIVWDGIGVINIIMFAASMIPQIKLNFESKSSGQLAIITVFLAFAGNAARVFTTIQEVNDPLVLIFWILGTFLNGTVLLQILIYGGSGGKKETTTSGKKETATSGKKVAAKAD